MQEIEQKNEQVLASWTAREFIYHQKNQRWFMTLGLFVVAFFAVAILMENYIFALLVLLTAFLIIAQALKHPVDLKIQITAKGISINEKFLPYAKISSFWIFEETENKKLSLINKGWPKIPQLLFLENQDPEKIKGILKQFIAEKEHVETLAETLAERLKF